MASTRASSTFNDDARALIYAVHMTPTTPSETEHLRHIEAKIEALFTVLHTCMDVTVFCPFL